MSARRAAAPPANAAGTNDAGPSPDVLPVTPASAFGAGAWRRGLRSLRAPLNGSDKALVLEWRLVGIRWIGIVTVGPALLLAPLDSAQQALGLGLLAIAGLYNVLIGMALRHRPALIRNGYLTSICDALLNAGMIIISGGFDSQFHYLLFTVTISAAMRYGFGQAGATVGLFVGLDLLLGMRAGRLDWQIFLCRSGFLAITALLAGYLREQAQLAAAALEDRLYQARRLDEACHLLGAGLQPQEVTDAVAAAAAHLFGATAAVVIRQDAADSQDRGRWLATANLQPVADHLERLAARGSASWLTTVTNRDGAQTALLTLDVPDQDRRPAQIALALPADAPVPASDVRRRFLERAALALEKSDLYRELAQRNEQLQAQVNSDPLTGLLNHRALLTVLEHALAPEARGVLLLLDIDNFKLFNDTYGHVAGDTVLRRTAEALRETCPPEAVIGRYGGDEFLIFVPGAGGRLAAQLTASLLATMRQVTLSTADNQSVPIAVSAGSACAPQDGQSLRELLLVADTAMYQDKRGVHTPAELGAVYLQDEPAFAVLESLILAVDRKDHYTREHSLDVTRLALILADRLGLGETERRVLAIAGPLHDLGKIAVPDAVLRKPGRLTAEEYALVQQHVAYGVAFIRGMLPHEEAVLAAVAHHHERWDGRGYPHRVPGPETPLLGRVMQIADAVSAMMLDRPYRRGLAWPAVVDALRGGAGSQFDPSLVEPFIAAIEGASRLTSAGADVR